MTKITYRKLSDGAWGILAAAPLRAGDVVTVTTKAGISKTETVAGVHGTEPGGFTYYVTAKAPAERRTAAVGDMAGVLALFARASAHIKKPAIKLACGGLDLRLTIATSRAQVPGSVNVVDETDPAAGRWLGRILVGGTFEASRKFDTPAEVLEQLLALAARPAETAAAYGRLTGRCAFCSIKLSDGRSTAVGYGETCAGHYGLPWGETRHTFKAEGEVAQEPRRRRVSPAQRAAAPVDLQADADQHVMDW